MASAAEAAHPLPTGQRLIVTVGIMAAVLLQVLDTTIANVALTTIAGNLGESADTSIWIITAFAVANGVTLPLTGWLMQRFGVVRTFTASVFLFTIASLLCGLAWSLPSLILFRIVQGAVSGPMIPGSQALLIAIFPPAKRGTALGIWSATTLAAPVFGPVLGGYISDNFHWSWIFLINVPLGIPTLLLASRVLVNETPATRHPLDVHGLALLPPGLVFVVFGLSRLDQSGGSADAIAIASIAGGLALIAGFVAHARGMGRSALLDLGLFRRVEFRAASAIAFFFGLVMFAGLFVLPL